MISSSVVLAAIIGVVAYQVWRMIVFDRSLQSSLEGVVAQVRHDAQGQWIIVDPILLYSAVQSHETIVLRRKVDQKPDLGKIKIPRGFTIQGYRFSQGQSGFSLKNLTPTELSLGERISVKYRLTFFNHRVPRRIIVNQPFVSLIINKSANQLSLGFNNPGETGLNVNVTANSQFYIGTITSPASTQTNDRDIKFKNFKPESSDHITNSQRVLVTARYQPDDLVTTQLAEGLVIKRLHVVAPPSLTQAVLCPNCLLSN